MTIKINRNISILEITGIFYTFAITFKGGTGSALVQVARLLLVAGALISIVKSRKVATKTAKEYYLWSTAFLFFCTISILWASQRYLVRDTVTSLLYVVITDVILVFAINKDKNYLFTLMKVVVWSAILHGLRVYLIYGPTVYFLSRGGSTVENATILGYVAPIAAICAFILLENRKVASRVLYNISIAINIIFAVMTASRKVVLYLGIFFAIYYILRSRNPLLILRRIIVIALLAMVALFAFFKVPFLYNLLGYRFETMINGFLGGSTDGSTGFRLNLIRWGLEWFSERPILGYGIGCYRYLLGSSYNTWVGTSGVYAHNNYIELLVGIGIVGTMIYYALYIGIIGRFLKGRKNNGINIKLAFSMIVMLAVTEYGQISYSIAYLQEILVFVWFLSTKIYADSNYS